MNFSKYVLVFMLLICGHIAHAQLNYSWRSGSSGGYHYKYVNNDPLKTRFYTLKNGLKVILSQNTKEPQVVFRMVVRAGANTDPKTSTGLAHYLEHLLFKGTDRFGTLNYEKEKPLLDKIRSLYESYRRTADSAERKLIYKEIDATAKEASNYSIANEYDKMMKIIGSSSTNAYTSSEKTVYEENFPSNAVDKFLAVQAERFRSPVFRLFHTELETVYEEKNRTLDDERNKVYQKMMYALFPTHNYGQQTTIGTIDHLKNPSLVEIEEYYQKYYVPNNMAIIMAGDFNYDELIQKIDSNFSYMKAKPFSPYSPAAEASLKKAQTIDVFGPGTKNISLSYRGVAQNTHESLLLNLISRILTNGKAGLIDVNINQQQRMLGAGASYSQMKDYGVFMLTGSPKEGQTLQQAKELMLDQIELVKRGDFDESLIKATVANLKLTSLRGFDNNDVRVAKMVDAFVLNKGEQWDKELGAIDRMSAVSKKEIVLFASHFFSNNYVAVFKHKGVDKSIAKVTKPEITAVKTNSNKVSSFAKRIIEEPITPIAAKFLDYKKELSFTKAGNAEVISIENTENEIFRMTYRFDLGSNNNKLLSYASQYLDFLNTDKYSLEEINKQFYTIACSYHVNVGDEQTVISIGGLQENFEQAVSLLEHILSNCKLDEKALTELKSQNLKSRENAKLKKDLIMYGLTSYAQFGPDNPFNYGLTNDEIKDIKAEDLMQLLHNLTKYKHIITYYGPLNAAKFSAEISKLHALPVKFREAHLMKNFVYRKIAAPEVFLANYEMVQAEISWMRNIEAYNPAKAATISTFNNYFGDGMGSVVPQIIRESKALAYSTFAMVWVPDSRNKQISTIAYVGTQADKMNEAIKAMDELLNKLPESKESFELAKASVINRLETSRITKDDIIRAYLADKKLGYTIDSRKDQFKAMQSLSFEDVVDFHRRNLSGQPYSYCILGPEKAVYPAAFEKLGNATKLSLEQIFGY